MFNTRKTLVRRVLADEPEAAVIAEAAEVLRQGGLVAFPTETVYGLGANALDAAAVEAIYTAKGRPAINPIIVHVSDVETAKQLTPQWSEKSAALAAKFWPGPLTLVVPKGPDLPSVVTAGGATVGLRVPAHPVALALLRAAKVPVAAPSANRSRRVSPTLGTHVQRTLNGRIDMLLDAGPTPGGLESTVLDMTVDPPRVLRPGLVSVEELEAVVGPVSVCRELLPAALLGRPAASRETASTKSQATFEGPLKSPGQLDRHYAPRAQLLLAGQGGESIVGELLATVNRVGWLRFLAKGARRKPSLEHAGLIMVDMPRDPTEYAARLYAALHEMDEAEVERIVVDLPPDGDAWLAVHDRLRRAAQE